MEMMTGRKSGIMIRPASPEDAEALLNIYAYYVRHTAITFDYEVPDPETFREKMEKTMRRYPYLAAETEGRVTGYAYAGPFVGRAAYDWSAEMTVYVDPDMRKLGIGRKLYEAMEESLRQMGILNLYACIGYPQKEDEYLTRNSVQFHEHMGYRLCGTFRQCG